MKRKFLLLVIMSLFAINDSMAQNHQAKGRMDRSRLNIGAYILQAYARSEQHVKDVADCGIDFMTWISYDKKMLDLFQKYHIGAVVNGVVPGWWGGEGEGAGQMKKKNPISAYEKAAKIFKDHPAIWGIDIGDEPSALDFPHLGEIYKKVGTLFPNQFPFLNLYPNYASVAQNTKEKKINQLGTATYQEHIAQYLKNVPADYLCYDFYLYSVNVPQAYENLRMVADACLQANRSVWIVLQVNSNDEKKWITENQLRFQAYTAMAFGVESILWGCYTAGWWHNNVLDKKGNKTPQYDKLKRVNAEIHKLGEPYMKYKRVRTDFVSFEGTKWLVGVRQKSVPSLSNGVFSDLKAKGRSPLVVGTMVARNGSADRAIFICTADDPYDNKNKNHTITFKANGRRVMAHGTNGDIKMKKKSNGTYTIKLRSNQGVLIEALAN